MPASSLRLFVPALSMVRPQESSSAIEMPPKRLAWSDSSESLAAAMGTKRSVKAKPSAPLPVKIVERVLPKLDTDQLADAIAGKLSERLLTSLQVDSIVSTLLEKYGSELDEAITAAIVEKM